MADADVKHVEYKQDPKVRGQDIRPFAVKNASMGAVNPLNQPIIISQGLSSFNNFSIQNANGFPTYTLTQSYANVTTKPPLTFTLVNDNINVFILAVVSLSMNLQSGSPDNQDVVNARVSLNNGVYLSANNTFVASPFASGTNFVGVSLTVPYLVTLPRGKYTIDIQSFINTADTYFSGLITQYNLTSLVFGT